MLKRKIDIYLKEWKSNPERKPLVVKGARQVGKSYSIREFAKACYENFIELNFVEEPKYKRVFDDGYDVDSIIKNISLLDPDKKFIPHKTLIFFDELQDCPSCATSLKFFKTDGRYDVVCSGSMMGINYNEIESNSVGYKQEYEMYPLDFEEFLWAKGYDENIIEDMLGHMKNTVPFSEIELDTFFSVFRDYMIIGGMPEVVQEYIRSGNFSGTIELQRQLMNDYREDIIKYAQGLDKGRILGFYDNIPIFLAKENKRYQVTKLSRNARNREYSGVVDWLRTSGIVNVCYCLDNPELPLKGNYNSNLYKVYYNDTGLLVASLDEEAQEDLRVNRNFGTYKGAIYENVVSQMLRQQGYGLYYYKRENPALEMDFFVRDAKSLIPVEVKASDGATLSLNRLIENNTAYPDIRYGIKLGYKNIGFNGKFYTFPYFVTFLLKRFLRDVSL